MEILRKTSAEKKDSVPSVVKNEEKHVQGPVYFKFDTESVEHDGQQYKRYAYILPMMIPRDKHGKPLDEKEETKYLNAISEMGSTQDMKKEIRGLLDKLLLNPNSTAEESSYPFIYPTAEIFSLEGSGKGYAAIKVASPLLKDSDGKEWEMKVKNATEEVVHQFLFLLKDTLPIDWRMCEDESRMIAFFQMAMRSKKKGIALQMVYDKGDDGAGKEQPDFKFWRRGTVDLGEQPTYHGSMPF